MSDIKVIFFDFDDTLVSTNTAFNEAKNRFQQIMKDMGIGDDRTLEILNHFDIANVQKCGGFAKECFPNALVQTYIHYCEQQGKRKCLRKIKEIEGLGWEVINQQPELLDGAVELLEKVSLWYKLFLVTKGDEELQILKVSQSGLTPFFYQKYVVADKNDDTFQNIIAQHNISPSLSWSVGNSIKADINPALKAGVRCIHVQTPSWDFEHAEPIGNYYKAKDLWEVLSVIKSVDGIS